METPTHIVKDNYISIKNTLNKSVMLHKKDEFINWYIPSRNSSRESNFKLRVRKSKGGEYITISKRFVRETLMVNDNEIKAAISFDYTNRFITFNPVNGVPFIIFKRKNERNSYIFQQKKLVTQFKNIFDLDFDKTSTYDFNLIEWETINGMKLYRLDLEL